MEPEESVIGKRSSFSDKDTEEQFEEMRTKIQRLEEEMKIKEQRYQTLLQSKINSQENNYSIK